MTSSRIEDGWKVRSSLGIYRFLRAWDVLPEERPRLVSEREAVMALRAAVEHFPTCAAVDRMREELSYFTHRWGGFGERQAPVEEVVEGVRAGRLVAVREVETRPVEVYRPKEEEPWEKPADEPVKVKATLEVKFVYDQADKGVGGLEFKVRPPDGPEQKLKTDGNGVLKVRDITPGYVEIWSDVKDARLETTVTMRAEGETPTVDFTKDYETKKAAKHLLRVDALRVHEGDGFKSLAEECDVTWEALALFNFGTDDEKKVKKALEDEVGCLAAKGLDEVKFSDFDSPGLLYLPTPWKASFHTSQTPVIRLAGVDRPTPLFLFSV